MGSYLMFTFPPFFHHLHFLSPSSTIFIYKFSTAYLFITSLHVIKSIKKFKEINRTLEKDEGNLLYF
jgi:hypothetical protein